MGTQIKELILRINDWLDKTFSPNGKKIFLAIIALIIFAGVFFAASYFYFGKQNVEELDSVDVNISQNDENQQQGEVDIEIEPVDDTMVSIPVEDLGRANPFLPEGESAIVTRPTSIYGSSLMAPPEHLHEGSDASKIMTTKVSGILFDNVKPSAILNIEGRDYLVRIGDIVNNYKVLSITKDLVMVELNKNTYKAGVGQLMTEIQLNHNTIYDLPNRFGGAKK